MGSRSDQPAEAPFALTAGDQLSANGTAPLLRKLNADEIADVLAWRGGTFVFDVTPLPEALARFAHYHRISIKASPSLDELVVSGRYPLDDLSGFLTKLENILPVMVTHDSSGTTRVIPRP
ncbi:MAG: hypothetical protein J6386_12310 [Candidatus Synoicihabitans palmerolidicus]|nr:hypothetical protein [Candidatus Synoicihabitans palmerolidicus]